MITINGISYEWQFIGGDLVLMIGDTSLIFKDAEMSMARIAAKELEAQMGDDGFTWPTWAQQEFEMEFVNDEAQLTAYCLGAWSDKVIEHSEPYEPEQLKRSA